MEILVVVLIIAVLAALAFAYMQRSRGPGATGGIGRSSTSPIGRTGGARGGRGGRDSMAAAVADHADATDPHDVIAAEQRMQAQASQVSAGLQARARQDQGVSGQTYDNDPRDGGYAQPAAGQNGYDPAVGYADTPSGYSTAPPTTDLHLDDSIDPQTGQRTDGYDDPNQDPRLNDKRYEGRIARDYDPNTENPEYR